MGICTLLDRIDESMLDTDSSGIVSREISDKGFVSWGVCKRVFLTTSMSSLAFPSSPAALSFLASFAACLVNTTFHMLTTPGNLRRCSRKDYSWMNVSNYERVVGEGAMISQAGGTTGTVWGTEVMHWGEAMTSWANTPQHTYIRSSLEWDIGHGEGAAAWGYGKVRSANLTMNEVTSDNIFLLTLEDAGTISLNDEDEAWTPGMHNFVGENGLVYGVPYTDEFGQTVMPDMGRVEATNGTVGYMAIDDIEVAVFNGAKTQTEQAEAAEQNARDEAKALRAAFADYYGIDALSDAAAYQCIIDVRYEGGTESAKSKMERDTSALLAEALDEGEVTEARLSSLSHSGFANNLTISDAAFEDILNIAKENMKVSVPVYSVEGAVVGEYSFVRF